MIILHKNIRLWAVFGQFCFKTTSIYARISVRKAAHKGVEVFTPMVSKYFFL